MRKMQFAVMFVLVLLCAGQVLASDVDVSGLLRAKGCYGCHYDRISSIGPSYQDVSRHYKGIANARETLARVILNGTSEGDGGYRWGAIRMPPPDRRVPVDRGEADVLVNYILSIQ